MHWRLAEAKCFAIGAHLGQKYSDKPYWHHLGDVCEVLERMGWGSEFMLTGAWLHDVIEDTPATYQDIREYFGHAVAEFVWSVTDEMGRNRKERKEKTYPKIFSTKDSTILKLADLGANIEHAVRTQSKMLRMHVKEWTEHYNAFREALAKHEIEGEALQYLEFLNKLIQERRS